MKTASLVFEETMSKGSPDAGSHATEAVLNRARSNTWSVGCEPMMTTMTEELLTEDEGRVAVLTNLSCSSVEADSSGTSGPDVHGGGGGCKDPVNFRKNWTRRNAWGNLSYAELITKAIEGSPEKRLTLSQIYDWIVHNVDYFANKGDNSSSAGWKNSIRHNLSLHSRFVRLVNDGAGKSSWWSINPDAQPLKPSRRRAATLDSKTLRKRNAGGGGAGGEPGAQRKVDFAGRSLEEVDSTTTSGVGFSILSPGNSRSQDDVGMAMDVGINGSPSGYPRDHGFARAGSLPGTVPADFRIAAGGGHETGARPGSGSPPYGVRGGGGGGFRMELGGVHGGKEGARVHGAHGKHRRNYVPTTTTPLEDRAISLGFCAGNGISYDEMFDPHSSSLPSNGYYPPKRYFDETGSYATGGGLNYGGGYHSNGYYPGGAYTGGFYGNGGCFGNRAFPPDGRYTGEGGSVPAPGSREVSGGGGGGHVNGQVLRSGGFPEVQDMEQNGGSSRSKDGSGSSTGDENRELNAFPMTGGYCSPSYIDLEGGKGAGGVGGYNNNNNSNNVSDQGSLRHRDDDCFRNDGLQRNPSVSRFQDVAEPKTETTTLTDTSFFRALTTTSGYADDFPSIPDAPLRPISSPGTQQSSNEPFYRSMLAAPNKYPYLPDPAAALAVTKPFSQLLANRAAYPTCRNSSTLDGFYIPTTF